MKRKILFNLSAPSDVEYQAALQTLRARQSEGWRLEDESEDEDQGQPIGVFHITDGDFKRRIQWGLSPQTRFEFRSAIEELRARQAEQWVVFDADRELVSSEAVGVIAIEHA